MSKYTSSSTVFIMLVIAMMMLMEIPSSAFTSPQQLLIAMIPSTTTPRTDALKTLLLMVDTKENEVLELVDEYDDATKTANENNDKTVVAPFLSQGQISDGAMEMNWNDPKQARVMFYIILSLLPVLFLIPLMLGSRDLIPVEALPPVPLN
jgi:hypothetical protein